MPIARRYGPSSLSLSFETIQHKNAKQYYALARYQITPLLLNSIPCSDLYFVDTDLIITKFMLQFHQRTSKWSAAFSSQYFYSLK